MSQCKDVFCENKTSSGYCKFSACTKNKDVIILNENEWLETDDGLLYKELSENGRWIVIRFKHDAAVYSYCPLCGYCHPCYKNARNKDGSWSFPTEYDPNQEFNYCPMCGEDMEVSRI